MIFLLIAVLAALVPESFGMLPRVSAYVGERSNSDRKAADLAEDLKRLATTVQTANVELAALTAACSAAVVAPSVAAALATEGRRLQALQEMAMVAFKSRLNLAIEGIRRERSSERRLPGVACGVPGLLMLAPSGRPLVVFESQLSGFRLEVRDAFSPAKWRYAKSSVVAWP